MHGGDSTVLSCLYCTLIRHDDDTDLTAVSELSNKMISHAV